VGSLGVSVSILDSLLIAPAAIFVRFADFVYSDCGVSFLAPAL
jgi:hypothetical protein